MRAGLSLPRRSGKVRVGQDVEFEDPVLISDLATKLGKRTEGRIGVITGERTFPVDGRVTRQF